MPITVTTWEAGGLEYEASLGSKSECKVILHNSVSPYLKF